MPTYNQLAEPKVVMKKRRMTTKYNLGDFAAFWTSRIDTGMRSHEFVSLENCLTVGQEFKMWPGYCCCKFVTNIFVRFADIASNCGQASHPSVFEERKPSRQKGKQTDFVIT